ncbi:MAG TPA: hypothetical protein VGF48_17360 [Thermoanaerobaculia bacterium]|jgi:hypothetical protein
MRSTLFVLALLTACAPHSPAPDTSAPDAPPPATPQIAPWNANPAVAAPPVLLTEWQKAENRASCAPMTFADYGNATPRRANFSGGWGLAFDAPGQPGRDPSGASCATCGRGTFGIAGAGVEKGEDAENVYAGGMMIFAGKNRALYDLEGGTGPNWLAQIHVDDQRCIYYVWSFQGRAHVEQLIRNVRRVRME